MQCEHCRNAEATVHVHGSENRWPRDTQKPGARKFDIHLCLSCAKIYQQSQRSGCLFPNLKQEQRTERLRIMSVTPEHIVVRLVRTEALRAPEDWVLLSSRWGSMREIGTVVTMTFTPAELAWLKGDRHLEQPHA